MECRHTSDYTVLEYMPIKSIKSESSKLFHFKEANSLYISFLNINAQNAEHHQHPSGTIKVKSFD